MIEANVAYSRDNAGIPKMDISTFELYKIPRDPYQLLICLDEKSKQLFEDIRVPNKDQPGKIEKYDYEYKRKGTCNIFLAAAPKAGKWIVIVTATRKKMTLHTLMKN